LNYGIGERITDSGQIAYLLETYLSDAEIKEHLQDSFVSIPPNHFHLKIKGIVKEMVAQRERNILLQRNEQKTVSAQASPIQSNSF
jgi:hypothetical protein